MSENNPFKANLKISLYANDVLIAESKSAHLWQKVLSAIASGDTEEAPLIIQKELDNSNEKQEESETDNAISIFAKEINVDRDKIIGACRPSMDPPYIQLDKRYWEKFLNSTPRRGPQSISKLGLASTILCFWFEYAGFQEAPTVSQCQNVLATINAQDNNPTRSLTNSEWIQKSGKGLVINPAKTSRAIEVCSAYCMAMG